MKKILINESQLDKLFEYHAQQRLPFDDDFYGKKNASENYLDWIKQFGKIGTLGKSSITFEQGFNSGLQEGYNDFCEVVRSSMEKGYLGYFEGEGSMDFKSIFYRYLGRFGFYNVNSEGKFTTKCKFNRDGNMYIERVVCLENNLEDTVDNELYDELVDKYQDNVGGCWSWKAGKGSGDYVDADLGGANILLRGWIRLDDIDWAETVYLNSYDMNDECEIRVKPNAKVELFDIKTDNYRFNLGGKHIIVSATYFGDFGTYEGEYAKVNGGDKLFRDRKGSLYTKEEMNPEYFINMINKKLKSLRDPSDIIDYYDLVDYSKRCVVIRCNNLVFPIDVLNRTIIGNTYYDNAYIDRNNILHMSKNGKTSTINMNNETYN